MLPNKILAATNDSCIAACGNCKTTCDTNESNIGSMDCPTNTVGDYVYKTTCCVPPGGCTTNNTTGSTTNTSTTATSTSTPTPQPAALCGNNTGVQTAIGCIPVLSGTNNFLAFVLRWAVGIGGGIAFLLMIYSGFMIMTAAGNPERLKAGQELLTSAISGLILLIFSVFILKFIGIDILGLCHFGFGPTCT
jgi:hypothetical protein